MSISSISTMPVSCCAVNCTNRFTAGSGIGFFVFPVNNERRKLWVRAISRDQWQPKATDRICGQHFVSGRPSKDPENIDHVPMVFKDGKRRVGTVATDRNREERRALRSRKLEERKDRGEQRRVLQEVENAAAVLVDLSASRVTSKNSQGSVVEEITDKELAQHESLLEETIKLQATNQELLFRVIALEKALNAASSTSLVSIIISNDDALYWDSILPYI